jgi:RNA polymerase sigma-70 factor (ECF subfamily)
VVSTPSDTALAAAYATGDRAAGAALLERHLGAVRGFLAVRCRDAELAEELTQEAAARVALAAARLDGARDVGGYLIRIAHNVWRDWLRRELVRRRGAADAAAALEPAPAPADAALLADEVRRALAAAVAALPRAQREVVRLRYGRGLTYRQIADRLGRPLGTVLGQMRAALGRLRAAMEDYR